MKSVGITMSMYLRGEKEVRPAEKSRGCYINLEVDNVKVKILTADGVNQVFYIARKNLDKYQEKHGVNMEVLRL